MEPELVELINTLKQQPGCTRAKVSALVCGQINRVKISLTVDGVDAWLALDLGIVFDVDPLLLVPVLVDSVRDTIEDHVRFVENEFLYGTGKGRPAGLLPGSLN